MLAEAELLSDVVAEDDDMVVTGSVCWTVNNESSDTHIAQVQLT